MKRERNTVGGDSSSEPFLWCLICNCSKKTSIGLHRQKSPILQTACLFLLATRNPRAPLTIEKKKEKEYHLTYFTFPLLFSDYFSFCLWLCNFDPVRREQRKVETSLCIFPPRVKTQHSCYLYGQRWTQAP